jgi:hypothetical protein
MLKKTFFFHVEKNLFLKLRRATQQQNMPNKRRKAVGASTDGLSTTFPPNIGPALAAYTARREKSTAARRAGRAAERAINRHRTVNDSDEVELLQEQLDAIDESDDDDAAQECDLIKARFEAITKKHNAASAHTANETLTFECCMCLENCDMTELRVNIPCAHGFCSKCGQQPTDAPLFMPCPTCEQAVTAVIIPSF